ncbi:MAG: PIG-L deacetylase family protein [Streptosporangiaceae bacterium]
MADVLDDAQVARILAIVAHPDDVDFGAAGTIARWTDAGIAVTYCVVTDGDAGGTDQGAAHPVSHPGRPPRRPPGRVLPDPEHRLSARIP